MDTPVAMDDAQVDQMFHFCDKDANGLIDVDELVEAVRGLGADLPREACERLFSMLDENGDKFVSLDEFRRGVHSGAFMTALAGGGEDASSSEEEEEEEESAPSSVPATPSSSVPATPTASSEEVQEGMIRQAFFFYDEDESGFLSEGELHVMINDLAGGARSFSHDEVHDIFVSMDESGDGEISLDEFITAWKQGFGTLHALRPERPVRTAEEESILRRAFDYVGKARSSVDEAELLNVLDMAGGAYAPADVAQLFVELRGSDGGVTFERLRDAWAEGEGLLATFRPRMQQHETLSAEVREQIEAAFVAVDKDGSNSLDLNEVRVLFAHFHTRISEVELRAFVSEMDEDGNQEVSRDEFVEAMAKRPVLLHGFLRATRRAKADTVNPLEEVDAVIERIEDYNRRVEGDVDLSVSTPRSTGDRLQRLGKSVIEREGQVMELLTIVRSLSTRHKEHMTQVVRGLENEVAQMRETLDAKGAELGRMFADLEEEREAAAELRRTNHVLVGRAQDAVDHKEHIEEELRDAAQREEALQGKLAKVQEDVHDLRIELDAKDIEEKHNSEEIERLQQALSSAEGVARKLDEKERDLVDIQKKRMAAEEEVLALRAQVESMQSVSLQSVSHRDELAGILAEKKDEMDQLRATNTKLTAMMSMPAEDRRRVMAQPSMDFAAGHIAAGLSSLLDELKDADPAFADGIEEEPEESDSDDSDNDDDDDDEPSSDESDSDDDSTVTDATSTAGEDLSEELARMRKELQEAKDKHKRETHEAKEKHKRETHEAKEERKKEAAELKEQRRRAQKEAALWKRAVQEADAAYAAGCEEMSASMRALERDLKDANSKCEELRSKVKHLQATSEGDGELLREQRQRIESLDEQLRAAQAARAAVAQVERDAAPESTATERAEPSAELVEAQRKVVSLQEQLRTTEARLAAKVGAAEVRVAELESAAEQAAHDSELLNQLAAAESRAKEADEKARFLKEERRRLEAGMAQLKDQLAMLREEHHAAEETIADLRAQLANSAPKARNAKLERELDEARQRADEADKRWQLAQRTMQDMLVRQADQATADVAATLTAGSGASAGVDAVPGGVGRRELAAYDHLLRHRELKIWLELFTQKEITGDLYETIEDGVLLCDLANALEAGIVEDVVRADVPAPVAAKDMAANLRAFTKALMRFGVTNACLFDPVELLERRSCVHVLSCIAQLGHVAAERSFQPAMPSLHGIAKFAPIDYTDAFAALDTAEAWEQSNKIAHRRRVHVVPTEHDVPGFVRSERVTKAKLFVPGAQGTLVYDAERDAAAEAEDDESGHDHAIDTGDPDSRPLERGFVGKQWLCVLRGSLQSTEYAAGGRDFRGDFAAQLVNATGVPADAVQVVAVREVAEKRSAHVHVLVNVRDDDEQVRVWFDAKSKAAKRLVGFEVARVQAQRAAGHSYLHQLPFGVEDARPYADYVRMSGLVDLRPLADSHDWSNLIRVVGHDVYHRPVVVVMARNMPDPALVTFDHVFLYFVRTLHTLVADEYHIVFVQTGAVSSHMPSFGWLRKCYRLLPRPYKKKLKRLTFVEAGFWVRFVHSLFKPFISSKFNRKLQFRDSLRDLLEDDAWMHHD